MDTLISKTSRDGRSIEITMHATRARVEVAIDGKHAGDAGGYDLLKLARPNGDATYGLKLTRKMAVGLTDDEARIIREALDARGAEMRARHEAKHAAAAEDRRQRQAEAIAACPEDHVAVTRRNWANGDLMSAEYETEDGVKVLASDQLDDHGCGVWYLPQAEVETARTKQIAAKQAAQDRRAQLRSTEVPAEAVAAYRRCGGDPERLTDDIDNPDYWLVRQYADAIEEQGIA